MPDPKVPDDISYPDRERKDFKAWMDAYTFNHPSLFGPLLMHPAQKAKLEKFLADDAIEGHATEIPLRELPSPEDQES